MWTLWREHRGTSMVRVLRLRSAPSRSQALCGMPARRLSPLRSLVLSRGARRRAGTHFLLGADESLRLACFVTALQNAPAQQRQFLYLDAVSPYQSEIGPDSKWSPHPIHGNASEREHAASQILCEACENELHLICAPSRASSQLPRRTWCGRHGRLGES